MLNEFKNEFRLFCEKPPKGFEKYFKPEPKSSDKNIKLGESKSKDVKETKSKETKPEAKPESSSSKSAPSPGGPPKSRPYDQWSFGLFGGTGSRQVQ